MDKRYITWSKMCHHVQNIIDQVAADKWNPDIIVGVSRGGVLPAAMISHKLKARMVCLHVALRDDDDGPESNLWLPEEARDGTKILIVDDINDSGATINWIKEDWTSSVNTDSMWGLGTVRFASIIHNKASSATVSYHSEIVDKSTETDKNCWYVFPIENWWEETAQ